MLENLIKTLENAPVIKKGDYSYLVQGIVIESENLREMVELIIEKVDFKKVDKIVAIQSMGLPIGTALSLETDLPLIIVRKRQYGLEGERIVHQKTGYDESIFYINNIKELGKETIAGKECTKYSMTMDMMGNSMERSAQRVESERLQELAKELTSNKKYLNIMSVDG